VLSRVTFVCANLKGGSAFHDEPSSLYSPRLSGVDLSYADFSGADLDEVFDLDRANVKSATYDKATTFPDGFDPIKAGMKFLARGVPISCAGRPTLAN